MFLLKIPRMSGRLSKMHLRISQDTPRISVKLRYKSSSARPGTGGCPADYWQLSSRHPRIYFGARAGTTRVKTLQMPHRYPRVSRRMCERSPKDEFFTTRHQKKIPPTYFLAMCLQGPLMPQAFHQWSPDIFRHPARHLPNDPIFTPIPHRKLIF